MKFRGILKIVIIFLLIFLISNNVIFASEYSDVTQFDDYHSNEANTGWGVIDTTINKMFGTVLSICRTVAFCLAIIMLMVIGIKYMTSVASERKAETKRMLVPYVIGAIVLFTASGILQLVTYLVNDVLQTS